MNIASVFPMLGQDLGKIDGRNPSATKKGPGRKPKAGHVKNKQKGARRYMKSAQPTVQQSQTDNVANVPLKAATRGG